MPSNTIQFVSLDEAVAIHERLIKKYGGKSGLRDLGLLESALYRPQTGYYNDLAQMAAALFESLLINPPFVDGNKRMAFFTTDVLLRMNGWEIEVSPYAGHEFIIKLLSSDNNGYESLVVWLNKHLKQIAR